MKNVLGSLTVERTRRPMAFEQGVACKDFAAGCNMIYNWCTSAARTMRFSDSRSEFGASE